MDTNERDYRKRTVKGGYDIFRSAFAATANALLLTAVFPFASIRVHSRLKNLLLDSSLRSE
jgi:hypothetical protein